MRLDSKILIFCLKFPSVCGIIFFEICRKYGNVFLELFVTLMKTDIYTAHLNTLRT